MVPDCKMAKRFQSVTEQLLQDPRLLTIAYPLPQEYKRFSDPVFRDFKMFFPHIYACPKLVNQIKLHKNSRGFLLIKKR